MDNIWTVVLATKSSVNHTDKAIDVAVHAMFRPLAQDEPIYCQDPLNLNKMKAEGRLKEKKKILCWLIDCRKHKILLPLDKKKAWIKEIK